MKQTIALLFLMVACCTAISLNAANGPNQGINWQTNYESAVNQAKSSSKPIILFFTGSDWCGWCNRLDEEVFNTAEFAASSKDKFIFVKIDFPLYTALPQELNEQNKQLKKRYDIRSFPTLVVIDPQEQQIGTTGYRAGGAAQYAAHLDKLIGNYTNYKQKVQNLQEQKLGGEELKKLYQKSKELDLGNDACHIIKLGMESDEKVYFLTEHYRFLAEEGLIHSPESIKLKQQLLALDPQNEKHLQYDIAVIEFEASCEEMQKENYSSDLAVAPLVHYINKYGSKDKDNLWRLEMIISQVYLDKNRLNDALKHAEAARIAAPPTVQSEIASAVASIQSQISAPR
jgi:protein disulfide-isomerase